MISPLENLSGPGKPLKIGPPDPRELEGLKRSGLAKLQDALSAPLTLESRFDLAYNAAHALCLAAMRRCGIAPAIATSYSSYCHRRWILAPESGECCPSATTYATSASTRAI